MTHASDTRQLQRIPAAERREASNFTIAVVMAGIFAFFIAGIASAFIYAKETTLAQAVPAPSAAQSAPAASTAAKSPPAETTGSAVK